jgi:uridine kinase
MLGDILLIQEKHKKAGEVIIRKILENKKDKYIVAISGESGSGKSELTHVIAKGLRKYGIFAKPLHIDNFYNTHPLERRQWRSEQGIENVVGYNEYLWDEINRVIKDFRKGGLSGMPCVDLVTEQVDRLITDFSEVDMLIVDGLYAIKTDSIDLRVFIDLTYLETKEKHTLAQEHKMVQSLKPLADLIISKDYEVEEVTK